jgi:two-component system, OmpR family, alkaline phosphatase synthesis response regulator PhoP
MVDVERTASPGRRRGRPSPFATRPTLPVADDFDLDLVGHRLRHHGQTVHLRPREFQLLATLAANPGRAFTRRQLIALAWGSDDEIGLRTVDVHVHWLRSKIEVEPGRPTHLLTIRGFGYRLDPDRR